MKIKIQHFSVLCSLFSVFCFSQSEPDLAWVKRIGNSSTAGNGFNAPAMAVDEQGNSYLTGGFFGQSFTLDGIALTAPIPITLGKPCGYIAKYNSQGQIIWAKTTVEVTIIHPIAYNTNKIIIDKQGNIYICGVYRANEQAIINGYYLNVPDEELWLGGFRTHFIAKLDTDGEVLWGKTTSHPDYLLGYGSLLDYFTNEIHFDPEGNINMTGGFSEYMTFSPEHTLNTDIGEAGVYLAKYSPDGEVLSAKKLEGTLPLLDYQSDKVRADATGKLYRWATKNAANPDKTLYRYDKYGELLDSLTLTISATGTSGVQLNGFAVSPAGDVAIGGLYFGTLTLNGTTYPGSTSSTSNSDAVLFKLSAPSYEIDWVDTYVEPAFNEAFDSVLMDEMGSIYTAGYSTVGQVPRIVLRKYNGSGQLLWHKMLQANVQSSSDYGLFAGSSLCQTKNGGNVWVSGYFTRNAYFSDDYHFTLPNTNPQSFNGFVAQYGVCDTENPVITEPVSTQLCEGESLTLSAELSDPELTYFWSTPTGAVLVEENTITATLTVTQPGKYSLIAQEDEECYGKSQEVWVTQVALPSDEVVQEEQTLTATENTENTTYQWVDCDNGNYPVEGATAQSFTPSVSGSYAVEVTNASGCSVVSECYNVSVMSIKDIEQTAVVLYPNPATTMLYLETPQQIKRITIINMAGQTVLKNRNTKEIDVSALAQGYYIITAKTDKGIWKSKFVKR